MDGLPRWTHRIYSRKVLFLKYHNVVKEQSGVNVSLHKYISKIP